MIKRLQRRPHEEAAYRRTKQERRAVATMEFALCLPLIVLLLLGLLEVGRITQVSNIMWNAARESARNASLGQDNFQTVANNLLAYLQAAMPNAFNPSHSTSFQSAVITLPANTTGYTCWDTTANRELFTITFTDVTNPTISDPTSMQKLDHYQISVQVPYSTIAWDTLAQITGVMRMTVTVDWACMVDAPFQVTPTLPAE